ncbi:MAG TPA: hypothetical protein VFL99_04245 [Segeticoccus sp.]|uniref:hypothetical protein n=1 Tax=Segeticoccus sp. TaxID=2706531 RepID=UPI002D80C414|nr:hypothetical protein [Segeticoccus sp.]HET8599514.1 hypothetical protein [Segeticoccus sp.]
MADDVAGAGQVEPGRGAADQAPPQVRPRPGASGDVPVKSGARRVLGMKVAPHGTSFYFLAATGPFTRRYARRFPLTEAGWLASWNQFAAEDPAAAAEYFGQVLHPEAAVPAPPRDAQVRDPQVRDAWCVVLGGLGVLAAFFVGLWALVHAALPLLAFMAVGFVVAAGVGLFGIVGLAVRLVLAERWPPPRRATGASPDPAEGGAAVDRPVPEPYG